MPKISAVYALVEKCAERAKGKNVLYNPRTRKRCLWGEIYHEFGVPDKLMARRGCGPDLLTWGDGSNLWDLGMKAAAMDRASRNIMVRGGIPALRKFCKKWVASETAAK